MIETLMLGSRLQTQIGAEARAAFPRECCGLMEGIREGSIAKVFAIHPARNLAKEDDRFEIDPATHIGLLRRLRGGTRKIIGCYHSHPNGPARPSVRDREAAIDRDFLWLIVSIDPSQEGAQKVTFGAFEIQPDGQREVPVLSLPGHAGISGVVRRRPHRLAVRTRPSQG
jgi:proteasome lid subunit RPN8/RPN11